MQERSAPRRSFDGHTLTTPWDKLHELYFVSYAFLNYLSTPFLFAESGFEVAEGNPYFGAGEKWRRLHVKYPAAYPTHSRQQTLYFNEEGLLQRPDNVVEVVQAGSSHFCLEYETVDGIVFPTHRRALGRDPKREEPDRFGSLSCRSHDHRFPRSESTKYIGVRRSMRDHSLVFIALLLAYFAVNVLCAVRVRGFTIRSRKLALLIYMLPFSRGVHSSCWK